MGKKWNHKIQVLEEIEENYYDNRIRHFYEEWKKIDILRKQKQVNERWAEYFEKLVNKE